MDCEAEEEEEGSARTACSWGQTCEGHTEAVEGSEVQEVCVSDEGGETQTFESSDFCNGQVSCFVDPTEMLVVVYVAAHVPHWRKTIFNAFQSFQHPKLIDDADVRLPGKHM